MFIDATMVLFLNSFFIKMSKSIFCLSFQFGDYSLTSVRIIQDVISFFLLRNLNNVLDVVIIKLVYCTMQA